MAAKEAEHQQVANAKKPSASMRLAAGLTRLLPAAACLCARRQEEEAQGNG
jgi:hypothetical protein